MPRQAILRVILVFVFSIVGLFIHADGVWAKSGPTLNNGQKWRIGYYEGGPFSDYTDTMRTLVLGLIELGWIKEYSPPDLHRETPKAYWNWLSLCNSPFLSFKPGNAYSAGWDNDKRSQNRKRMLQALSAGKLDLVIAMGTWAGQDLANNQHMVPTLVLSTSDPIKAGIIKSAERSGYDHVTARVDPDRYLRQIRMFHRIVGFRTLGVAFENTPDGRIYSAIDEIYQIARERDFKVKTCEVIDSTADTPESDNSCLNCYRQLASEADAVYVTPLTCVDRQVKTYMNIFREADCPSFSMIGSKLVQQGIMMSISSDSGYAALGRYNAEKFGKILNGAKPADLEQLFQDPLDIAINMETVRQIGFDLPKSILIIATEIYER